MEKSIKHVEKLVHATNSALAQMKFSLMFDDMTGSSKNRKLPSSKGFNLSFGEKCLEGDDLWQCQDDFKLETMEMLAKIDSLFPTVELPRKNSKALDRMKEINRKMNKLRLDQSKPVETQQSREKLLTLISEEKFSPRVTSSESFHSKQQTTFESKPAEKPSTNHQSGDSIAALKESPIRSKEELKEKILETEEIVSRGFRTARQLAQKMETMSKQEKKDRTPARSDKTVSEVSLRSLEGKTESNETVSTVKCRRCLKLKKKKRNFKEVERVNAHVIEMTGNNLQRNRGPSLCMQRLPSLHIKGGLQLQKVHNLEIPAGGDSSCGKTNTSVRFLCHEKMENEKLEEVVQRLRKDCCSSSNSSIRGNYVECCNCGKLMKIREPPVDPRKVDEILRECNFNVFDPRIDEFVEKCGMSNFSEKSRVPEAPTSRTPDPEPAIKEIEEKEKAEPTNESAKERRHLTLQGLSDRLLKKYKKETETIENNHLKLDRILQSLFREVDASREVFECCHFDKSEQEKMAKLSTSKPLLITLEGTSSKKRKRRKKFGKTDVLEARKCKTGLSDIGKTTFCSKKSTETEEKSLNYFHPNENALMETKEPSGGFVTLSDLKPREIEESPSQVTSTSSTSGPWDHPRKKISENVKTSSTKQKTSKTSGIEETQRKPHGTSALRRSRDMKSEIESVSDTFLHFNCDMKKSFWSTDENNKELKTSSAIGNASKENFREGEVKTVGEVFITPSSSKEVVSPLGTSSGRSEDNYESDFESMTNEPEENGDKEEQELKLSPNKLSTISEVDSDLEKKVTDEQKTARSDQNGNKSFEMERSDNSEKNSVVKKNANASKGESPKNAPGELVTSLKDILSALRDQFTRTESLAEKLTESSKAVEKTEKTKPDTTTAGDFVLSPWKMPDGSNLVGNLLNTRKENVERSSTILKPITEGSDKSEKLSPGDSLSDEGGSSLGEIRLSDRRRRRKSGRSDSNSISENSFTKCERSARVPSDFNFDVNIEEVLYSEGEIPSEELERSEGEVLSGKNSVASSLE